MPSFSSLIFSRRTTKTKLLIGQYNFRSQLLIQRVYPTKIDNLKNEDEPKIEDDPQKEDHPKTDINI